MKTHTLNQRQIDEIAAYVEQTNNLDEYDRLRLSLRLIEGLPDVRPEVASYLKEAICERMRILHEAGRL